MALRKNVALVNAESDAFGVFFNGGTLKIYTGSQPVDPNSAASGTLLCTITIPTPAFGAASAGSISKAGTWSAVASDTGTAGYARMASSDTLKTLDITVTESGAGGDAIIDDDAIVNGNTVTVTSCTVTMPAQ